MTTRIPVSGGDFRPYEVIVGSGLLAELGSRMAPLAGGRTVVITDKTVAGLHGPAALASLEAPEKGQFTQRRRLGGRRVTVSRCFPEGNVGLALGEIGDDEPSLGQTPAG